MQLRCDRCGQRTATFHQTMLVGGQKRESHFCEECARETGQWSVFSQPNFSFPNLSLHQLLSSFLGQDELTQAGLTRSKAEPKCQHCGMTYSQFAESGRLGCAQCYDQLEPHLVPLIKRIHGTTSHGGKAPKRTGGIVRQKRELANLRQQLHTAIHQEQYEEAARMRDAIRAKEGQIQAGGEESVVE